MRPAWRRGTVPRLRGGASSWGGSDHPVQVELFQQALMPGGPSRPEAGGQARTRRRPGTRTAAGPGCRPGGAGRRRVSRVAGFRFLAAEEPDRIIPVAGPAGPGEVPAFRLDVAPCALNARAADQPHPAVRTPPVHTHCDHHPGASRRCKPRCSAYPGGSNSPRSRRPPMKHLHS